MKITGRGVEITEIFKTDRGESIEISPNGSEVTMHLINDRNERVAVGCSAGAWQQFVAAVSRAETERAYLADELPQER